jgi:hypothetical protein
MAIPPEPIQEILPQAAWVLDAEVLEVLSTGAAPPPVKAAYGATSTGKKAPSQVVKLKVKRVLQGKAGTSELVVEKPEATYALRAGNKGPFLLDASTPPKILGRHGPDNYDFPTVEKALKAK